MEWGDRRVRYLWNSHNVWPRVKELLLLQLQTSVCKNQPHGVQREDTGVQIPQNPSHIIFCLRQQPTETKCPVLKGRSAKLLSRLSTASEWNRHPQICVSHLSNKYSVERRNLSQRMHGARDRLCSQALPFCRDLRQRLLAGLNVPPCELREGLGVEKRYLSSFITGLPVIEGVQEKEAKGRFYLVENMHENVAPSPQGNLPEVRNPFLFALLFLVLWIVSGHSTLTQEISHGPSFVEASNWHSLIIVAGRQWRDTLHPNNLQVNIAGSLEYQIRNQKSGWVGVYFLNSDTWSLSMLVSQDNPIWWWRRVLMGLSTALGSVLPLYIFITPRSRQIHIFERRLAQDPPPPKQWIPGMRVRETRDIWIWRHSEGLGGVPH